jgi:hypothetical protein
MPVFLTPEFLLDLKESKDARFIRSVLTHTITADGDFQPDPDDHRYKGIADAWIRYVSRGTSALRVIFIRRGEDVFLYRAGPHSVEDNLSAPSNLARGLSIAPLPQAPEERHRHAGHDCCLLKTTEAQYLSKHLAAMYHVRLNQVFLVSPFIEASILASSHPFGRFLDRAVEESTEVHIITCYHDASKLQEFKSLEERGMFTYFLDRLHTKLYLFDVDVSSLNAWQRGVKTNMVLGSSNLTFSGLGLEGARPNEELNCRLPSDMFGEIRTYVQGLAMKADDYMKYAFRLHGRRR